MMNGTQQVTPKESMEAEKSTKSFAAATKSPVFVSLKSVHGNLRRTRLEESNGPRNITPSPQNGDAKNVGNGTILLNGQSDRRGPGIEKPVSQPPAINDDLIAESDEGFPLISAVFSLAASADKGKSEGNAFPVRSSSGAAFVDPKLQVSSNVALQTPSFPTINNKVPYVLSGNTVLQRTISAGSSPTGSRLTGSPPIGSQQNGSQKVVSKVVSGSENIVTQNSTGVTMPVQQVVSPVTMAVSSSPVSDISRTSVITSLPATTQLTSGVSQLVKFVNSAVPVCSPPLLPLSTTSGVVVAPTRPAVSLSNSSVNLVKPAVTQPAPRQILIKPAGEGSASLVLNLLPGEPVPKTILIQGTDGKPGTIVRLTEGTKPFSSSAPVAQSGGKILIPVPTPVSTTPVSPTSKQIYVINKVPNATGGHIPIAPHPTRKPNTLGSLGISSIFLPVSGASVPLSPILISSAGGSTSVVCSGVNTSALHSSRTVVSPSVSSLEATGANTENHAGLTTKAAVTFSPKTPPSEQKAKTSGGERPSHSGLSPQESRIQRLKELLKQQEDAVDKLREKRRIEIESVRDPSLSAKRDNEGDSSSNPERPPLTEQKRSASPFAVPLPPKKPKLDSKTKLLKPPDSTVPETGRAFIPNADDKAFVQLVGLENVVNSIK